MKLLEEDPAPRFDLCFVDGAHSWGEDGLAFFLADRLLEVGGWMIFDDLDWTRASAPDPVNRRLARKLAPDERHTAEVRKVYELLVKPHPSYGEFRTEEFWAYARKLGAAAAGQVRTETVVRTLPFTPALGQLIATKMGPGPPSRR